MQVVWYNPKRVIVGTYYVKNSEYSSFYHTSQGKVQNWANLTFFQLKYIHKKKKSQTTPQKIPTAPGFLGKIKNTYIDPTARSERRPPAHDLSIFTKCNDVESMESKPQRR